MKSDGSPCYRTPKLALTLHKVASPYWVLMGLKTLAWLEPLRTWGRKTFVRQSNDTWPVAGAKSSSELSWHWLRTEDALARPSSFPSASTYKIDTGPHANQTGVSDFAATDLWLVWEDAHEEHKWAHVRHKQASSRQRLACQHKICSFAGLNHWSFPDLALGAAFLRSVMARNVLNFLCWGGHNFGSGKWKVTLLEVMDCVLPNNKSQTSKPAAPCKVLCQGSLEFGPPCLGSSEITNPGVYYRI